MLPIGFPHRLVHGDHLCFLIDEAHPEPTERIAFARPQQLVPSIQRALVGAGRRQYLTISLHGFRNGNIGIRSYGAHRERIEDPDIFAGDIMSVWHEQDFSGVLVHAAFPHYGDRDSDGAINFHFIVLFEPAANHVVLLQRRNGGPDDFVIVETDAAASLRTLSSMSPWTFVMPRGLLGERPLQQADLIEVENGMHFILYETMPAPDTGGTSLLQVHAKVLSPWYEEDLGHGRTVGRNGQRTLRPPGNGHGKRVSFKEETFFVTSDNEHSAHKKTDNPFLIDLADDLRQDVTDDHYNCFITNLRLEASFDKNPMLENDFLDSLATIHGQFGFCNDFVSGFCNFDQREKNFGNYDESVAEEISICSVADGEESPQQNDKPRTSIKLDILIPETLIDVNIPLGINKPPDWLTTPWEEWEPSIPEHVSLHRTTQEWIAAQSPDMTADIDTCFIFTDGSFIQAKQRGAWAFVVCFGNLFQPEAQNLKFGTWYADLVCTDASDASYIGATKNDSTNAETTALSWAALFALAHRETLKHCHHIVFCYDALNLGHAAAGLFAYTQDCPAASTTRSLHQAVETHWGTDKVHHWHCKAHVGHPVNELVDVLAYEVARLWLVPRKPPIESAELANDTQLLRNLWVHFEDWEQQHWPHKRELELVCPERRALKPLPLQADWTFSYGSKRSVNGGTEVMIDCQIVSHNVQSLLGKIQYYRAQAHSQQISLLGLQETCTPESRVTKADGYLRLSSAACQGVGGIEAWISQDYPFGWIGKRPVFWDLSSVVVIHQDAHLLLFACRIPELGNFVVAVGHAPHNGRSAEDREAWWRRLSALLRQHQHQRYCIMLLDANAQVGSCPSDHIGGMHASDEDDNGAKLHALLIQTQCWLPSTFSHTGHPATWFSQAAHQRNGRRIDYVALPLALRQVATESWSSHLLDTGHSGVDHLAACVKLNGLKQGYKCRSKKDDGVDWQAVRAYKGEEVWRDISGRLPQPAWQTDPHLHWQQCHEALIDELAKVFPRQVKHRRRHYISEEAWAIRNSRNYHRKIWRSASMAGDASCCAAALSTWRDRGTLQSYTFAYRLATILESFEALAAAAKIKALSAQLKQQIKLDKVAYLEDLSTQAMQQPTKIYQVLRKAGFGSQRKKRFNPLPMIRAQDGNMCDTIEALQEEWLRYFADIEGGHPVGQLELLQLCQHDEATLPAVQGLAWCDLPSLKDVEDALRRCKLHTAAGTDRLVPEIFHRAPKWMAKWLYPLFAKIGIYASEPIHWKGGILHAVYKNRGEHCDPGSFRGILVSSHVGKVAHGLYRKMALQGYMQQALPLQCGGIPKRSVAFAAHSCRLQQHAAQRAKMSTALLFVDIKSAYYRLIRELCVDTRADEQQLRFLLQRLRLPAEQLIPLLEVLKENEGALHHAEAPAIAKQMAAVFHRNTWFHICGAPLLARTLRGARPGDGWADLLFNYLMAQVLHQFESSLAEDGLNLTVHWNGLRGLRADGGTDYCAEIGVTAWADDLAFALWHDSPAALVCNLQGLAERLVPHFGARGLELNFAAGKTEAVVCLRGGGSIKLRRELFGLPDPGLTLETDATDPVRLRLLQQYVHLGGVLHSKSKMKPELRRRLGIASSAFAQHRSSVYQNVHLSLSARVRLFEACVLSTAYFNCGTWTNLAPSDLLYFNNGILRLYRRILAKEVPYEQLQHWTTEQLSSKLMLPTPEAYLRIKRLGYYGTVMTQAPIALWSLIAAETTWLTYVKEDLQWLHELTIGRSMRPSPAEQPEFWDSLICEALTAYGGCQTSMSRRADSLVWQISSFNSPSFFTWSCG